MRYASSSRKSPSRLAAACGGGTGPPASEPAPATIHEPAPTPPAWEATWNVWTAPSRHELFEPLSTLEPNRGYVLTMDLSGLRYGPDAGYFYQSVSDRLDSWLDDHPGPTRNWRYSRSPDMLFFEPQGLAERWKVMSVDLERVRRFAENPSGFRYTGAYDYLSMEPTAEFRFGTASFGIRTRHLEGWASIALSIWVDGRIPIDEIAYPVCIAHQGGSCDGEPPVTATLAGVPALRGALQADLPSTPTAALHFLELNNERLLGVFRCNDCPRTSEYFTWNLGRSARDTREYLSQTALAAFEDAALSRDDQSMVEAGRDLFRFLFRANSRSMETSIRNEFVAFIDAQRGRPENGTLYVRLLPTDPAGPFVLPVGLMNVPTGGPDGTFVGFELQVETPSPNRTIGVANSAFPTGRWSFRRTTAGTWSSRRPARQWRSGSAR